MPGFFCEVENGKHFQCESGGRGEFGPGKQREKEKVWRSNVQIFLFYPDIFLFKY